ncbi:MAG TPA: Rrf2 family transcriptional regulator [Anaeromyxobacteraceae bacterium]|nr:Rrf2 family transcriptional regulator [Anaeromyxobacteraceae bacterium]
MTPNRKAEYALRALVDLAIHAAPGTFASTASVARRTGAPAKFLEAILGELRRAGLVESRRGAEGGHRLARAASSVHAGEAWRAVSGPVAGAPRRRLPASGAGRAVHQLLADIDAAVAATVDAVTIEDLARRSIEADGVADYSI